MKKRGSRVLPVAPEASAQPSQTAKASKAPPPTQYLVADSVFNKVAKGSTTKTVSIEALSDYLVVRGNVPLDKVQTIFNQLDTNGDGSVDRDEWRIGFTNGIIPGSSSK